MKTFRKNNHSYTLNSFNGGTVFMLDTRRSRYKLVRSVWLLKRYNRIRRYNGF